MASATSDLYGYLSSRRTPPPLGRYQIILLGDRGTWVWTTCPELLPSKAPAGNRTCDLSTTSPTPYHYTTEPGWPSWKPPDVEPEASAAPWFTRWMQNGARWPPTFGRSRSAWTIGPPACRLPVNYTRHRHFIITNDVKRGQNLEAETEANFWRLRPRPRPKIIMKKVPNIMINNTRLKINAGKLTNF